LIKISHFIAIDTTKISLNEAKNKDGRDVVEMILLDISSLS